MHEISIRKKRSWLAWFLYGMLALFFLFLLTRSVELQVIKGEYFRSLSEGNRVRRVSITAPRGLILARGGESLADRMEVKKTVVFESSSGYTKVDPDESTPKDEIISDWVRVYPKDTGAAHFIGYMSETGEDEVSKVDPKCMDKGVRSLGSWVGRTGLEETQECFLRGVNGEELVEVSIRGEKIRTLGRKPPEEGSNVLTTIDYGLQKKSYELMKDMKGALIATDGKGEILSMVSTPSFDPNIFLAQTDESRKAIEKILTDKNLLLFNRAIGGAYHPGSIFKLVTSAAALSEGVITSDFQYEDVGSISVNEFTYTTWFFTQYGRTEGVIDLSKALSRSTDTFFYKVGELAGIERLIKWAKLFNIGDTTGIDIPGEIAGLLPTPEWKKAMRGESWYLGNTYHFSIGQGDLTTTPLQANILTSVFASRGRLCKPHVVSQKDECQVVPLEKKNLEYIIEGMKKACEQGGTGAPFFDFEPRVACKTGTAEVNDKGDTHAWFTVFAPIENPEIVVTVLIERGGEGSQVAAPIAKDLLNYWFHERQQ